MLTNLALRGFRGFEHFEFSQLGRINLLVGGNNSGKTSVLEAIHILQSPGVSTTVTQIASRRGETLLSPLNARRRLGSDVYDVSHLFFGRHLEAGSILQVSAESISGRREFHASLTEFDRAHGQQLFREIDLEDDEFSGDLLDLRLTWEDSRYFEASLIVTSQGGLVDRANRSAGKGAEVDDPISLVPTAGLSPSEITAYLDQVVLTSEEEYITEALQVIEPRIERIARVGFEERRYPGRARAGVIVKLRDEKRPIPLGSMGDGVWRLLGLSLGVAATSGGVILIDEIDTGLHYSVMESMWKLLDLATKRLNVQVFATTHSRDAYESLASVASHDPLDQFGVMIHRIEPDRRRAVAFTEDEIIAAAERGIEVR